MSVKILKIKEEVYSLKFDDFEEEIEIDSILKIDYYNLIGELTTFPIILNKLGFLLAESEQQVSETKLNLEIIESKTKEKFKNSKTGGKPPTVEDLKNYVTMDKTCIVFRKKLIQAQKTRDYMNSVYWSAKDKSSKLDKISLSFTNEISDTLLEGKVNNVIIKRFKNLIK